jgi:hypothetical protein
MNTAVGDYSWRAVVGRGKAVVGRGKAVVGLGKAVVGRGKAATSATMAAARSIEVMTAEATGVIS